MTQDEVIQWAREVGSSNLLSKNGIEIALTGTAMIEAFANKVFEAGRREEREACAKICENAITKIWEFSNEDVKEAGTNVCNNLAKAIRARK